MPDGYDDEAREALLAKAAQALQAGKIGFTKAAGRLVVPAKEAVNAVLEFIE